jgi:hypothetical protein
MTIQLNYREVAQANIDQFDRLGAFRGEHECRYHYPDGSACAIGVCLPKEAVTACMNEEGVHRLICKDIIETDNLTRLKFIQAVHDYRIRANFSGSPVASLTTWCMSSAPGFMKDLVSQVSQPADLTPELYKAIMQRLVDEA